MTIAAVGECNHEVRWRGRAAVGAQVMLDLLWLGIMAGLVALTLAYVRLCDNA